MHYPLRYPFAWLMAKMGMTITININFIYDDEEKVFVATSKDLKGLVLETESFDSLKQEIKEAIPNLLILEKIGSSPKISTDIIFKDRIVIAQ